MPAGFQLLQIELYLNYIYAVIANGTDFQVANYDWSNNYTIVSQSSLYPAYMDVTASSTLNPSIQVDSSFIWVKFHSTATGLTKMLMLPTTDLTGTATIVTHTERFIGLKLSIIDAYFYVNEQGHEYIFQNFLQPNQTQLYFFNNTMSGMGTWNIADMIIDQSIPGNFVAVIHKPFSRLWLTKINWTLGTTSNIFSSAYTWNYGMAPSLKSMGF